METAAKVLAVASSAFIFLPAGRDIFSYGTLLLPGEENVRPMMTMSGEKTRTWMWGMWGLNHCFMSLFKIIAAMKEGRQAVYCAMGQMEHGVILICTVQILSLGYLGFAAASKVSKD